MLRASLSSFSRLLKPTPSSPSLSRNLVARHSSSTSRQQKKLLLVYTALSVRLKRPLPPRQLRVHPVLSPLASHRPTKDLLAWLAAAKREGDRSVEVSVSQNDRGGAEEGEEVWQASVTVADAGEKKHARREKFATSVEKDVALKRAVKDATTFISGPEKSQETATRRKEAWQCVANIIDSASSNLEMKNGLRVDNVTKLDKQEALKGTVNKVLALLDLKTEKTSKHHLHYLPNKPEGSYVTPLVLHHPYAASSWTATAMACEQERSVGLLKKNKGRGVYLYEARMRDSAPKAGSLSREGMLKVTAEAKGEREALDLVAQKAVELLDGLSKKKAKPAAKED
ncbi:hypothetical protein JCM8547_006709 [Rhodosporidiobolus lusitaniae]